MKIKPCFVLALLGLLSGWAHAQLGVRMITDECVEVRHRGWGPFDYRVATEDLKVLVEGAHFTPEVENLVRGRRGGPPVGDIEYTLRTFPNHPRALLAMMRYGEKVHNDRPKGAATSIGCYFENAIDFKPDDGIVRTLYGIYLLRKGKGEAAIAQLEKGVELAGHDPNAHYNLGLAYIELKRYDDALRHAHIAYQAGFPLPGLRDKLKRAGHWREPVAPAGAEPPAATVPAEPSGS